MQPSTYLQSRARFRARALATLLFGAALSASLGACRSELATAPPGTAPVVPAMPISPAIPVTSAAAVAVARQCQATVATGAVTCGGIPTAFGGGLSKLTVGGQGTHLTLTSSNVSYTGTIFQFDVTVHNLMAQPLGTTDGVSADASGIRVVLASAPRVTAGTGSITAANADGTGTFTAPNQSYWQYPGNLATNTTSASKTWQLTVPATVTSFTFTVFVQAAIPHETGIVRWTAPLSSGESVRGVSCASATVCVAVGDAGTIRTTADGGTTWTARTSGTPNALRGVSCASATACVAVGASGTILASSDGGSSWTRQTSGTGNILRRVSCPSATACVAVGNAGTIRIGSR